MSVWPPARRSDSPCSSFTAAIRNLSLIPISFAASLAVFVFLLALLALQRRNLRVKQALSAEIEKELVLVQALMNAAPFPMFFKDVALRYRRINDAFVAFLGKSREEIMGQTASALAPPAQVSVYRSRDEDLLAEGGRQIYETVVVLSLIHI